MLQFVTLNIKHVLRYYNFRADGLLKKGLLLKEGTLRVTHFHELRPPETKTYCIY